jgi:hypothetical protein
MCVFNWSIVAINFSHLIHKLLGKLDFITNFISNHNLKANIVDLDHFLMLMASANDLDNILKI